MAGKELIIDLKKSAGSAQICCRRSYLQLSVEEKVECSSREGDWGVDGGWRVKGPKAKSMMPLPELPGPS